MELLYAKLAPLILEKPAIEETVTKDIDVEAALEGNMVVVKFRDSGPGIARPDQLFRPFQPGAHSDGLGLFISRAILRSDGGDLRYEPQPVGTCFVVELWPVGNTRSLLKEAWGRT